MRFNNFFSTHRNVRKRTFFHVLIFAKSIFADEKLTTFEKTGKLWRIMEFKRHCENKFDFICSRDASEIFLTTCGEGENYIFWF